MGFENASGVVPNEGSLYLINKNIVQKVISPVTVSNGLAWNKANNKFYYINTPTYNIIEYDYEDFTGIISNPRLVINMNDAVGSSARPDGMTIDKDDNLWVALHGAGSVVQVDAIKGKLMRTIIIPAQYVTSVMWGGNDFDILFVTTSRVKLNDLERIEHPGAGSLYAVTGLGTNGLPVFEGKF